jgi:tetratricopeptide (TPR) repeat protein
VIGRIVSATAALLFAFAASAPAWAAAPNAYADGAFVDQLDAGLHAFYARDFAAAQNDFARAVAREPGNTFAIAFLDAAAVHQPGALDALIATAEDRAARSRSYDAHVQLGFAYAFAATAEAGRDADARDEFVAAQAIDPARAGAHDGLGILREDARSANRAKIEFQAALARDPDDVLAREYLGLLYQVDLKDPVRALAYMIVVPNLIPGYADIDFHIASALYDAHQPAGAIGYATRGLELDVGHVGEAGRHGFTLLARIYLDGKQLTDARRVLLASIASNADADYATTLLHRLDAGDYGK